MSILVKTSFWPCHHFETLQNSTFSDFLIKNGFLVCKIANLIVLFKQTFICDGRHFQNGDRAKSWSLPECSKSFLFAIDSNAVTHKIKYSEVEVEVKIQNKIFDGSYGFIKSYIGIFLVTCFHF